MFTLISIDICWAGEETRPLINFVLLFEPLTHKVERHKPHIDFKVQPLNYGKFFFLFSPQKHTLKAIFTREKILLFELTALSNKLSLYRCKGLKKSECPVSFLPAFLPLPSGEPTLTDPELLNTRKNYCNGFQDGPTTENKGNKHRNNLQLQVSVKDKTTAWAKTHISVCKIPNLC